MSNQEISVIDNASSLQRHNLAALVFPGGNFKLEKRALPVALAINNIALGAGIFFSFHWDFEPVCFSLALIAVGAGVLSSLRGRWMALLLIWLPIAWEVLMHPPFEPSSMYVWVVITILVSLGYSSFELAKGAWKSAHTKTS